MFMRNYPERITAKRIEKEGRIRILEELAHGNEGGGKELFSRF